MEHSRRRPRHWFHVKPASAPEKRLSCRPHQSGSACCLYRTAVLHQQTALDLSRPKRMCLPRSSAAAGRPIPSGTTYFTGDRYRALGSGITLLLMCYGIRPTCLRGGRGHRVSSSSVESRLLRLVTSAESHRTLPSGASPLVSRETDSQTRRGRHGSADVIPRSALPG